MLGLMLLAAGPARAETTIDVASAADLVSALTTIDTTPGDYTINITADITLDSSTTLPAITGGTNDVTIKGHNHTLNGGNVQRGFFVYQGTVAIGDLTIQNTTATGGAGADNGGGGAGLGGALFVANGATVTVSNVSLSSNGATGGTGAAGTTTTSFGGGGGLGGAGADGGGNNGGGGGGVG